LVNAVLSIVEFKGFNIAPNTNGGNNSRIARPSPSVPLAIIYLF
jgi:hypothetical protein